jgi:LysM repeat protein
MGVPAQLYDRAAMVAKSARLLAPIALVAVALGVYMLVHSSLSKTSTTAAQSSTTIVNSRRGARHGRRLAKFYVVKPGDTLSAISSRTNVALPRLVALNRSLAPPYNLQTGQRLRLRR